MNSQTVSSSRLLTRSAKKGVAPLRVQITTNGFSVCPYAFDIWFFSRARVSAGPEVFHQCGCERAVYSRKHKHGNACLHKTIALQTYERSPRGNPSKRRRNTNTRTSAPSSSTRFLRSSSVNRISSTSSGHMNAGNLTSAFSGILSRPSKVSFYLGLERPGLVHPSESPQPHNHPWTETATGEGGPARTR